jgi:hypothetical protein
MVSVRHLSETMVSSKKAIERSLIGALYLRSPLASHLVGKGDLAQ